MIRSFITMAPFEVRVRDARFRTSPGIGGARASFRVKESRRANFGGRILAALASYFRTRGDLVERYVPALRYILVGGVFNEGTIDLIGLEIQFNNPRYSEVSPMS
jgi:hypothetical protein